MLQDHRLPGGSAIHPDFARLIVMSTVYDIVQKTELTPAVHLSRRTGCELLLKREDQQLGFSPHVRGAYNCLSHVPPEHRWRGIVIPCLGGVPRSLIQGLVLTTSAATGHYAQGIAIAAQLLKTQAVILIDPKTPEHVVHELRQMGCVVLKVPSDDALDPLSAALRLQAPCINLLRDPYTLAGIGTVGLEILSQVKNPRQLEAIFCSARAGGALEAIGLSVKQFAPQVKVIGVDIICAAESSEINDFLCHSSIADQQIKLLSSLAVVHENRHIRDHEVGDKDFMTEVMHANAGVVDEMIMVEPLEIQAAVKDTFRETRGIVDINGALAVAGMMRYASKASKEPSRALVAVISSAEVDFEDLKKVLF
ncbi:hypothetical protein N7523_008256 [Penicillium sp. IBT 18751x]|nr:hypothetical protein N7523_008256 [Penicillium sp. IBT 18751x]